MGRRQCAGGARRGADRLLSGRIVGHPIAARAPERYRASICLSGFVAPGVVPGTHPADGRLASLDVPVFYGYGTNDTVIPKFLVNETLAWLEGTHGSPRTPTAASTIR